MTLPYGLPDAPAIPSHPTWLNDSQRFIWLMNQSAWQSKALGAVVIAAADHGDRLAVMTKEQEATMASVTENANAVKAAADAIAEANTTMSGNLLTIGDQLTANQTASQALIDAFNNVFKNAGVTVSPADQAIFDSAATEMTTSQEGLAGSIAALAQDAASVQARTDAENAAVAANQPAPVPAPVPTGV